MRKAFWVLVWVGLAGIPAYAGFCESELVSSATRAKAIGRRLEFQGELAAAQKAYVERHAAMQWHSSRTSQYMGHEGRLLVANDRGGSHVLSLGSGPDVLRPLHDFPEATHYHLADFLVGWGGNPYDVVSEFLGRVHAISRDAVVTVREKGFLDNVSHDLLEDAWKARDSRGRPFYKAVRERPELMTPLVVEVEWTSEALGPQKKFFHLHPMDFKMPTQVTRLLARIPDGDTLGGVLITGSWAPPYRNLKAVLDRLSPHGAFVFETRLDKRNFTTPLKRLAGEFDILQLPPDHGRNGAMGPLFILTPKAR